MSDDIVKRMSRYPLGDDITLRRAERPAPTKPGWYYACSKYWNQTIVPMLVVRNEGSRLLRIAGYSDWEDVAFDELRWFGPVPQCVEAQLPTCPTCGSKGFDKSILPNQCHFCDGTENGEGP